MRSGLYHHFGVCLEDDCDFNYQFGAILDSQIGKTATGSTELYSIARGVGGVTID
jgi:hypothetical protein